MIKLYVFLCFVKKLELYYKFFLTLLRYNLYMLKCTHLRVYFDEFLKICAPHFTWHVTVLSKNKIFIELPKVSSLQVTPSPCLVLNKSDLLSDTLD